MEDKRGKGMFIVFEGIDGCGKSTQIKKFANYLFNKDKYNHIILTRNPYKDTDARRILREDSDPLTKSEKLAELFIADRKNQVEKIVIPNLDKGHIVISDRFKLSTITYQSAQGLNIYDLINKHKEMPIPDITFVIDTSTDEASKRMKNEEGRNEHKFEANKEFLENTRKNYHKVKEILDDKIFLINGNRSEEEIFEEIVKIFEEELVN